MLLWNAGGLMAAAFARLLTFFDLRIVLAPPRAARRGGAGAAAGDPYVSHMIVSADRSAGRPTTGWCRVSFRMVKLPRYGRASACRDLKARSLRRLTLRSRHGE